jgi:hypothetical protein
VSYALYPLDAVGRRRRRLIGGTCCDDRRQEVHAERQLVGREMHADNLLAVSALVQVVLWCCVYLVWE